MKMTTAKVYRYRGWQENNETVLKHFIEERSTKDKKNDDSNKISVTERLYSNPNFMQRISEENSFVENKFKFQKSPVPVSTEPAKKDAKAYKVEVANQRDTATDYHRLKVENAAQFRNELINRTLFKNREDLFGKSKTEALNAESYKCEKSGLPSLDKERFLFEQSAQAGPYRKRLIRLKEHKNTLPEIKPMDNSNTYNNVSHLAGCRELRLTAGAEKKALRQDEDYKSKNEGVATDKAYNEIKRKQDCCSKINENDTQKHNCRCKEKKQTDEYRKCDCKNSECKQNKRAQQYEDEVIPIVKSAEQPVEPSVSSSTDSSANRPSNCCSVLRGPRKMKTTKSLPKETASKKPTRPTKEEPINLVKEEPINLVKEEPIKKDKTIKKLEEPRSATTCERIDNLESLVKDLKSQLNTIESEITAHKIENVSEKLDELKSLLQDVHLKCDRQTDLSQSKLEKKEDETVCPAPSDDDFAYKREEPVAKETTERKSQVNWQPSQESFIDVQARRNGKNDKTLYSPQLNQAVNADCPCNTAEVLDNNMPKGSEYATNRKILQNDDWIFKCKNSLEPNQKSGINSTTGTERDITDGNSTSCAESAKKDFEENILIINRHLYSEILKQIEPHSPENVALTVMCKEKDLYHLSFSLIVSGEMLGCLVATHTAIKEANSENMFQQFLTFFIIDANDTFKSKSRIITNAFEFVST